MERIENCFVKFFLIQAPEIEPDTIQALIDQGYKTKISILAMDLLLDLPLITDIPLAQKSIIRKYIAFLQENSPFKLQMADDTESSQKQQAQKPNKKRKFDWIANDSDEEEDYPSASKNKAATSTNSRRSTAQIVSPKMVSPASVASSMNVSPIKPRRLSINFDDSTVSTSRDVEMANVKQEKLPAKTRGRPSRVTKKESVRTASQIRYENMKKLQTNGSNQEAENEEEESEEEDIVNQPPVRMEPTRKSSSRASVAPKSLVVPKVEPAQPEKFLTNAEKAMLAKIEARKLNESTKKRGRGRK